MTIYTNFKIQRTHVKFLIVLNHNKLRNCLNPNKICETIEIKTKLIKLIQILATDANAFKSF